LSVEEVSYLHVLLNNLRLYCRLYCLMFCL